MPTAFEAFVNAELPKRISIADSPGEGNKGYPKFTGVGKATEFVKCNYAATTAPTTSDDSADGYLVGSLWHDTTNDHPWMCLDASEGAAVWKQLDAEGGGEWMNKFAHAQQYENPIAGTYMIMPIPTGIDVNLIYVRAETDTGTLDVQLYRRTHGDLFIGTTPIIDYDDDEGGAPLPVGPAGNGTTDFMAGKNPVGIGWLWVDFSNISGSPNVVGVTIDYTRSEAT